MAEFFYSNFGQQQDQRGEEFAKRKKIYDFLTTPLLFIDWLNKFEQTDEIGKRGMGNEEPLIKFIKESTGLSCEFLDNTSLYVFSVTGNISLPSWVTRYLIKVTNNDKLYGDPVTPKDCIVALD